MAYGEFDVGLGICSDCSYEKFIAEMREGANKQLIDEFGQLWHNPNLYGQPIARDAPEGYAQRKAQVYKSSNENVRSKYLKPVIPIGYQDPYPFLLCRECLQKYIDAFNEG